jgi:hypothetical protein
MFGRHHTIRQLAGAFAITAVAAVVAASSASAGTSSSDRTRDKSCQGGSPMSWITITDDLGTQWLEPSPQSDCTTSIACKAALQASTQAPMSGWITVVDDLGIPYLSPVGQSGAPVTPPVVCVFQAAAPAAPVLSAPAKPKTAVKKKSSSTTSRFRHAESVTG